VAFLPLWIKFLLFYLCVNFCVLLTFFSREAGTAVGQGADKGWRAMETCKKQKIATNTQWRNWRGAMGEPPSLTWPLADILIVLFCFSVGCYFFVFKGVFDCFSYYKHPWHQDSLSFLNFFSAFWLVTPYRDQWALQLRCPPWLKPLVTPLPILLCLFSNKVGLKNDNRNYRKPFKNSGCANSCNKYVSSRSW